MLRRSLRCFVPLVIVGVGCPDPVPEAVPDPRDAAVGCVVLEPFSQDLGPVLVSAGVEARTRSVDLMNICDIPVYMPFLRLADAESGVEDGRLSVQQAVVREIPPGGVQTVEIRVDTGQVGTYTRTLFYRSSQERHIVGEVSTEVITLPLARREAVPDRFPVAPGCGSSLDLSLQLEGSKPVTVTGVVLNGHPDWSVEVPPALDTLPAVVQPGAAPLAFTLRLAAEPEASGPRSVELLVSTDDEQARRYLYRGAAWPEESLAKVRAASVEGGPVPVRLAQRPEPESLAATYVVQTAPISYDADDNVVTVEWDTAPGSMVTVYYRPSCE